MIYNYIKIAFRNIIRNKTYSVINILGLTIGISASIMIMLFVKYHLDFDSHVKNQDNKYRIVEIQQAEGVGEQHVAFTMGPLARQMEADFPEVKQACRIMPWGGGLISYGEESYDNDFFTYADTNVFNMLSIELIHGSPATALENVGSVCFSESMAKKVFGNAEDAMGKMIKMGNIGSLRVTGVFEDMTEESHLYFDVIADFELAINNNQWLTNWFNNSMVTYVELKDNVNVEKFEEKFRDYLLNFAPEERDAESVYKFYLQPYDDIHLKTTHIKFHHTRKMGNYTFVLVLAGVGLALLLIACINYINLSIARSVKRSREVGMRKVLGASRDKLIYQFMGESLIITSLSIMLSLGLVEILMPEFNAIMKTSIDFQITLGFVGILLGILILVSAISGFYPALYLSRYNPATVLKGNSEKSISSTRMTRVLVGFQFFVSTVLIIFIIVTNQQVKFIKQKDLGINYDNIVNLRMYYEENPQKYNSFKSELLQHSIIKDAAYTSSLSGASGSQSTMQLADTTEASVMVRVCTVDENFIPMMDLDVLEGRNFHKGSSLDSSTAVIVNQALVNYFGWKEPLGKRFQPFNSDTNRIVVGVVEDYHYYNLYAKIEPAVFMISSYFRMNEMNIKFAEANKEEALSLIEEKWNNFFPGKPFNPRIAKTMVMKEYGGIVRTLTLFSVFVLISLFISGLGLFGLSSLYVERKVKEIAIRKVLGGSVLQINLLIIKDFALLIGIAGLLAIPAGYKMLQGFFSEFAYHTSIHWYYFMIAIAATMILGTATVLIKSIKAAYSNPVDTLKYE